MIQPRPKADKLDHGLRYAVRMAALIAVAITATTTTATLAQSQSYPQRTVRIIVGYPPGGSTDIASRLIAVKLSERLRQPVIVENITGGGGIVGVDTIAKAPPDGHTIGVGVSGMLVINAIIRKDLPYNPITDLAPISMIFNNTLVFATTPSFPIKSVSQIVAMAKANPKGLAYGSSGAGTGMHLAGALLSTMTGAQLVHVPYRGAPPALQDLVAGQLPFVIVDVAAAREMVRAGRVILLATTGEQRALTAPNVPTVAESGVPGFAVNSWVGMVAPANVPPAIIGLLNGHLVAILREQVTRDRFLELGLEPWSTSAGEFRSLIKSEIARWDKFIKEAGLVFAN